RGVGSLTGTVKERSKPEEPASAARRRRDPYPGPAPIVTPRAVSQVLRRPDRDGCSTTFQSALSPSSGIHAQRTKSKKTGRAGSFRWPPSSSRIQVRGTSSAAIGDLH